jgi:hypothetical protein
VWGMQDLILGSEHCQEWKIGPLQIDGLYRESLRNPALHASDINAS